MKVIIEKLQSRGHQVTVVRTNDSWYIKETSPLYTSITLEVDSGFSKDFITSFVDHLLSIHGEGNAAWTRFKLKMEQGEKASLLHEKTAKLLQSMFEKKNLVESLLRAKYDLVLTDPAVPGGVILAGYLKLPVVFNVRWTSHGEGHLAIAPSPLSYVPMTGTEFSDKMSFFQRVLNVLAFVFEDYQIAKYITPHYRGLIKKYLGPDVNYYSLFQEADLWLMRVDFVFEFPRPTMPNVIYIGGFQCQPAKPLPDHLEEFMQSSGEHGVILMSLGTFVSELSADVADKIAAAFAKLPQKVIWRYKGAKPSTLGNNTLLVDWMPQNDLLGHPKIKLFVAHGGTNGVQEAMYHGVPVVGIPLFFDQHDNLKRLTDRGAAIIVQLASMEKDNNFLEALREVLTNSSYRTSMQRLSKLHRDQPIAPLDNAIFWIEFVMRHKGAAHLRTESYKMPWYTYYSVDVVFFLTAVVLSSLVSLSAFIYCLCSRVCLKTKHKRD
nr:UDP-glucuronosyltransferase 2A2-like [Nerophis lumbriciformis]